MASIEIFSLEGLKAYFGDLEFPCYRDDLISAALRKNAGDPFIRALEDLPKHRFSGIEEVQQFLHGEGDIEHSEAMREHHPPGP